MSDVLDAALTHLVESEANVDDARARRELPSGVVTREQLEEIVDEVAGVARKEIQALWQAALLVEERDHSEIGSDDVADSYERAQRYILEQNLASLPFHHQLLYELIRVGGGLTAGELHDRYEAVADDVYRRRGLTPISERSRRLKLSKLEDYELIEYDCIYRSIKPGCDVSINRLMTR
ncbi:hypothetical protein [Halomicrobium sp. LC1Hm]|uniref:hypothetical protein n=1 Tax=Halomicrobium sp. LC1Hm TaxID=2610902 RepID=UPI0012AA7E94|nr:hypothetical protein [Halomicrobium sp. LC1Hm]QGA81814.1 Cdc6-related protein, AAA superfamily ATPase [Halomicrobium sp. LC1Hm]